MAHGFRVYTVDLLEGMGRKPQDWQVQSVHYAQYAHGLMEPLADAQELLRAKIKWSEAQAMGSILAAASANTGDKFVRWISANRSGHRLSLALKYGTVGSFSDAMGVQGDTSIQDKAPSRLYRAELLLPEREGSGLLAVETISRTAPVDAIVAWLGVASRVNEKGKVWWRVRAEQATDAEYLSQLVSNSQNAELKLKHVGVDQIGNRPRTQYRFTAPLSQRQRPGALAWIQQRVLGHGDLEGLLRIVDVNDTGDFTFTDGHLNVDDGETTTRIGLSDVREMFTYPVSPDRPAQDVWDKSVRARGFTSWTRV